ncbi:MAG: hypothetical protein QOF17_175 [Solirubrobacteraceae bacterium]|nr:hypothetical protein [Solirubrobacteraceae bacterium]
MVLAVLLASRPGAPAQRLAQVAPPDALAWVHASTRDGDAEGRMWSLARRFPAVVDLPGRLAGAFGLTASGLDLARDVRPWLGEEAGIALVDAGPAHPAGTAPLVLAAVDDRAAAEAALRRLGARPAGRGRFTLPAPGSSAGLSDRLLAVGPDAAVRAALARDAGRGGPGLASAPAYRRAVAGRGDGGLDVYAAAAGAQRLLSAGSLPARVAAALVAGPALEAFAAEAEPADGGARVHARVLRTAAAAPPASFAPSLLGRVPLESTAAVLALPGGDALAALVARLGGAPALAALRAVSTRAAAVDLDREVLGPLRGEAVLSLQARGEIPVATLLARSTAPATTRDALARLQAPLAARLTGGAARALAPVGPGAFTLPVTARLQPSYALSGDVLVASTAQLGLDQAHAAARGVAQAPALAPLSDLAGASVQALGFLDLHVLLQLVERTGLAAGSGFGAVRADLDAVHAAGAVVRQAPDHPTDTTAELFLQIP